MEKKIFFSQERIRFTPRFVYMFLSTKMDDEPEEIRDSFSLSALKEDGIPIESLLKQETFDGFLATCTRFLQQNEDTFENRLGIILIFIKIFGIALEDSLVDELNKDLNNIYDFTLSKWFIILMDKYVKPYIEDLDMDSHISLIDGDSEKQKNRVLYASFAEEFIIPQITYLRLVKSNSDDYIYNTITSTFLCIKNLDQPLDKYIYNMQINVTMVLYFIGVDYYKFYFQPPSSYDSVHRIGSSPLFIFLFNFTNSMKHVKNWNNEDHHKLLLLFINVLNNRRAFFTNEKLSLFFEMIIIKVLIYSYYNHNLDKMIKSKKSTVLYDTICKKQKEMCSQPKNFSYDNAEKLCQHLSLLFSKNC